MIRGKPIIKRGISILLVFALILADLFIVPINKTNVYAADSAKTYNYTGGVQSFTAPYTTTYKFKLYGAGGGGENPDWEAGLPITRYTSGDNGGYLFYNDEKRVTGNYGGKGGYTEVTLSLTAGTTIYICVGGTGTGRMYDVWPGGYRAGGYNGGGSAQDGGCSGGGATHIATTNRGTLDNYKSYQSEILAVAGGGGGTDNISDDGTCTPAHGGSGGGMSGGKGSYFDSDDGREHYDVVASGSQTSGYAFGKGEDAAVYKNDAGGGGGGWYGGYSGNYSSRYPNNAAGGGGSGHIGTDGRITSSSMSNGANWGNGYVTIEWTPTTVVTYNLEGGTVDGSYTNPVRTLTYGTTNSDTYDWMTVYRMQKNGYEFGGFYTGKNGTGTKVYDLYSSGANCVKDTSYWDSSGKWCYTGNTLDIYAYWIPTTYTVTYDYSTNGGTSATKTTASVKSGASVDLTPTATKNGYTFAGWNTDKDATTKLTSYTMPSSNVTLYAIYSKSISASFISYNGTTKDTQTASVTIYNNATTGSIKAPTGKTKTRCVWRGWSSSGTTTADASVSYANGASITISGGETFYGLYNETITLSYDTDGGTPIPESQEATVYFNSAGNSTQTGLVLADGVKKKYHMFVSWKNGDESYAPGDVIKISTNTCVKAKWYLDDVAPKGTALYRENNETLGLWQENVINPYSVIVCDNLKEEGSGIDRVWLTIFDMADVNDAAEGNAEEKGGEISEDFICSLSGNAGYESKNRAEFDFVKQDDKYVCRFNLYDCLDNKGSVENVVLVVRASDNAENIGFIEIDRYDLGSRQNGVLHTAADIGLEMCGEYFARQAFRVEGYIYNTLRGGTLFQTKEKAGLRVYLFGNVDELSIDMASLEADVNIFYDNSTNLDRMAVSKNIHSVYLHNFTIPLYAENKIYSDSIITAYKGESEQKTGVELEVTDNILNKIRTILKY